MGAAYAPPQEGEVDASTRVGIPRRIVDVTAGCLILILGAPIWLPVPIIIMLDSRGNPFFRSERVGLGMRRFKMFKFRTMDIGSEPMPAKERGDHRVTRVGKLLRRLSLDELPQVLNLISGDMTLVGPRPEISQNLELYDQDWLNRFRVVPGMTGLWQVSGRSDLSMAEKIALDLRYIECRSVWLDIKIVLRTPLAVVSGRGAF
jgi:lipopolysaccharide/colanic/teichoic acid biosynthesis glycosyltransferase